MDNDSPRKAILVVFMVVLLASSLVSATVVLLRPIQQAQQLLARSADVMALSGLLPAGRSPGRQETMELYRALDHRIINLDRAAFEPAVDAVAFDLRMAALDPELSVAIPPELDHIKTGRRSRYIPVFLVWNDEQLNRVIFPIRGNGMWSALHGYLALDADLNTIADATFYEQNETPGLGDQITHPEWLAQWRGRRLYDEAGNLRFAVAQGRVEPNSAASAHEVDALTGATVTANAVTDIVRYWFGPHGYQPFLETLKRQPPVRAHADREN